MAQQPMQQGRILGAVVNGQVVPIDEFMRTKQGAAPTQQPAGPPASPAGTVPTQASPAVPGVAPYSMSVGRGIPHVAPTPVPEPPPKPQELSGMFTPGGAVPGQQYEEKYPEEVREAGEKVYGNPLNRAAINFAKGFFPKLLHPVTKDLPLPSMEDYMNRTGIKPTWKSDIIPEVAGNLAPYTLAYPLVTGGIPGFTKLAEAMSNYPRLQRMVNLANTAGKFAGLETLHETQPEETPSEILEKTPERLKQQAMYLGIPAAGWGALKMMGRGAKGGAKMVGEGIDRLTGGAKSSKAIQEAANIEAEAASATEDFMKAASGVSETPLETPAATTGKLPWEAPAMREVASEWPNVYQLNKAREEAVKLAASKAKQAVEKAPKQSLRAQGKSPRQLGTNPRAVDEETTKKDKLIQMLEAVNEQGRKAAGKQPIKKPKKKVTPVSTGD